MTIKGLIVMFTGYLVGTLVALWFLHPTTPTGWHGFQEPHPAVTKNLKGQYDC
jgi:hypothetical protein